MASRSAVRRLALARALSGSGSGIAGVALSYLVYQRTDSALWLAGTLFFTFGVTGFLTPLAGKIADRFDRRRVMIVSDLASLAIWSLLVFVRDPFAIAAIGFSASVAALPMSLAAGAALPNLVDDEALPWGNAQMSAAGSIARLAGPALGGGLYALGGAGLAFAVNAASFAVSAGLVASIRGVAFSAEGTSDDDRGGSSLEGFRVIRRDPLLLWITVAWTGMWLSMNIAYVADPPLAREFGVGPLGFGLIDTSFGAGALIGAVLASRLVSSRSVERPWVIAGMLGVAVGWAVIAVTPWFALVLVGSFIAASIDAVGNVAGYAIVQRHAPDAVRARVIGAQVTAGLGANMLGFVIVGPLVEALGPQTVYGLGAVLSVIAAATFAVPTSRQQVGAESGTPR